MTPRSRTLLDERPRVAARLRVQSGRQLVENRDFRVADQGERDGQPLLLAAGEVAVYGVPLVLEPEVDDQLLPVRRVLVERAVQL